MRPILIVVSAPILQLLSGIGKRHEPMRVQTLRPELAIEGLNERVIRGFTRPGQVQRHPMGIGPQIEVAADELGALVNRNRLWIADLTAHPFQRLHDIFTAVVEPRIQPGNTARTCQRSSISGASGRSPVGHEQGPCSKSRSAGSPGSDPL